MVPKTTRKRNDTPVSGRLYLAFELSESEWKLGFTIGLESVLKVKLQAFLAYVGCWRYKPYFHWIRWYARSRAPNVGSGLTIRRFAQWSDHK